MWCWTDWLYTGKMPFFKQKSPDIQGICKPEWAENTVFCLSCVGYEINCVVLVALKINVFCLIYF